MMSLQDTKKMWGVKEVWGWEKYVGSEVEKVKGALWYGMYEGEAQWIDR